MSYSVHFSFFMFFSVSRHISCHTMWVSHFPRLSVFSPYSRSYSVSFYFPFWSVFSPYSSSYSVCFSLSTFFSFLDIFQVLQCVCLIFNVFHFSRHILGPTVCISHFNVFQCFLTYFTYYSVCLSFSNFFSISHHILGHTVCISHFPCFLRVSRNIPGQIVFVSHFPCWSVFLPYSSS